MTNQTIAEFISHLKSLDVQVSIEDDRDASLDKIRLRCNAPEGTLTTELRQELTDRKAELISYLHQQKTEGKKEPFPPSLSLSPSPLSFAQQRLWFLYQLAPDNPFYNVPAAIRLTGTLDQSALERSFDEIVRRHATLRTTFTTLDRQPVQVVEPDVKVEVSVVNLQTVAVRDRERISQQLATAEAQRPFNLTSELPLRVTLLKFDSTEAVLLLTLHHIVADGWSLGVLIRELACCYTAYAEGRSPILPPLPIQYTDFARWQRNWLQGEVLEGQLAYWRRQLQDLPVLELPRDRARPAVQTYRGATYPLQISPDLTQALIALSQQSGASLFMTLLAAFQTLLYRYTGQEDIAIGSPIANRHRSEVEDLIGFFVNSVVMRSDLSGNPTFRELLERVRDVALAAYEHQELPFEKLVEELEPERNLNRNPLFQVAFALQNAPVQPLELPGLTLEPAPLESGSTRFDLEVHLWEPTHGLRSLWQSQEGLSGFISYSTELFDRDRIQRLVGHFQALLAGIGTNPDDRLSNLPLLTPEERQQILIEWNRSLFNGETGIKTPSITGIGGLQELCFHQIFETQVQWNPTAIALVSEQGSFTYAELNQRAEQLAQVLRQMGVHADSLVGLCVDRSADMVIGILGILKAGGAYVPLDPNYPSDRLHFMLSDTQVAILLTQSWLVNSLPTSQAQILCLDQPIPAIDNTPLVEATVSTQVIKSSQSTDELPPNPQFWGSRTIQSPPELGDLGGKKDVNEVKPDLGVHRSFVEERSADQPITPDHLAYVIYTSGSTGTPKGVLLSHRGLCNVVEAQQQVFHLSRSSRILQFSSPSFDASIFEIALALGCGGTLYIPPKAAQLPGMALVQFLQDNVITHALLTPAVLAVLPFAELPDLQVLITGGEACSSQVVDRWAANRHFFNAYGPTETTIWATVAQLHAGDHPHTIGRPILNTQIYILDANLNPVPAGIPGELYIGGAGLARGYLNRPELTAERFIQVEFSGLNSEGEALTNSKFDTQNLKLYKTGDRARYCPDGTIEFLGRVDHQIKIRGFRVELGEIEATLQRHPAIQDAVTIVTGESSNEMRLLTYFSLDRHHLQQTIFQALQTQQLQYWQTLYNQTYQSPIQNSKFKVQNPEFNITGWNSSYTGEPIPLEQMQEWVSDRVQQILALKPKRVLEIGCGTGLLLFQIAPHCQKYVGTDFSATALASVQNQLEALNLPQVELLHRVAIDFESIDIASFDVVILNSIVQYFPSVDYLVRVLEGAIQRVAMGGVLFVGDVRNLPLLTAFHTWVQFCQADADTERNQLQQRVERSQFEEPELAIDPMFFHELRDKFPQIQWVQIRLSRGNSQNEMTQFRYNVLLQVEASHRDCQPSLRNRVSQRNPVSDHHYDWKQAPITVEEIQKELLETEPEIYIITNVTNRRVNAAIKIEQWLCNKAAPKTVGRMRDLLQNSVPEDLISSGIDPQDWWNLESILPYSVEVTWSARSHTGDYDVLLIRQGSDAAVDLPIPQQLHPVDRPYTNAPLQANFARQLIPELRQYLRQTLPDYMVPSAFIPLETLPLTASGKVDRHALPTPKEHTIHSSSPTNTSLTPTEITLSGIWKELLRLKQVNIHDNFFELGGHSLLATQMTSRVRDSLGLELPLRSVFEAPTIAQLAPILETLRDTTSTLQAPPLVRLDRSAYRHKRSHSAQPALSSSDTQTLQALNTQTTSLSDHPVVASDHVNQSVLETRSPLIPLTLGGSKQPFFCVHPMFGVVFPYLELAHHLGKHRSFYGLQPLGLDGKSSPLNQIETIAAYYIRAIRSLQPQGPYFLGGWSFGGLVAFEMAQQLTQAGQQVGLLAILDTIAPCHKPSFSQSLKFLFGTALWSTMPFLLDYGTIAAKQLQPRTWFSRWQWSAIVRLIPEESRLRLLDESAISPMLRIVYANAQAAYRYTAQPYSGRVTLFKAAESAYTVGSDRTLGWSALATDVQLHQVPGNHLSLLRQPHVQTLAQQLRQCLT
jgi:amino acid adenylation domain-containing protein